MARPKNVIPTEKVSVQFEQPILVKARLEMFSEVEGRVPHGKFSEVMNKLLKDWLEARGVTV